MSNPWVTRDISSLLFYKSLGVISESQGAHWAVESIVTRDTSSLMLYESLEAVSGVEFRCHT